MKVKVRRIGTSLGVLLPGKLLSEESIKEGEEIEISLLKMRKGLIEKALGLAKGAHRFKRERARDRA